MDALERAHQFNLVAEQLIGLLTEENAALRTHDTSVSRRRGDEKTRLANAYAALFAGFAKDETALAGLEAETRGVMGEVGRTLEVLTEENGRLLKIAMQSSRTVLDIVAEAAKAIQPTAGTYGAHGRVGEGRRHGSRGVPLSVDESL